GGGRDGSRGGAEEQLQREAAAEDALPPRAVVPARIAPALPDQLGALEPQLELVPRRQDERLLMGDREGEQCARSLARDEAPGDRPPCKKPARPHRSSGRRARRR